MKISYRPEIDGLRAIAVAAVILFHAEFVVDGALFMQGGYLGVDIFFVISGYLISKIILTELQATDRFDFRNFYVRRARRIMPILLTVMIASFPFAWMYLLPEAFVEYSMSILAALSFFSNHFFYFVTTSYGADSSLLKPFLHTWSLSVEEQFYIVFPAMLFLLHRYARKHLAILMLAGAALSLHLAETLSVSNPQHDFYILPTRAWELLAGALLAQLDLRYGRQRFPLLRKTMPALGALFIAASILVFDGATRHPGFATLLLIQGTAMVVFFANASEPVGALLGSRLLVGTGLLSYSLYLWHFPVFAFGRISSRLVTGSDKLEWIALTLVLSITSYFLIEKPFRQKSIPMKITFSAIAVAFSVAVAFCGIVVLQKGFVQRAPEFFRVIAPEKFVDKQLEDGNGRCYGRDPPFCDLGRRDSDRLIMFFGDSHMYAIARVLYSRIEDSHRFIVHTAEGCYLNFDAFASAQGRQSGARCTRERQDARKQLLTTHKAATVVIGGRLQIKLETRNFDNLEGGIDSFTPKKSILQNGAESYEQGFLKSLNYILDQGHNVILVYPIPETGWNVPKTIAANARGNILELHDYLAENPLTTSYDVYLGRTKSSFDLLDRIQHPNLYRVYPHKLFCDNQIKGRCVTHDAENVFYFDNNHPSTKGAEMINDLIMQKINLIDAKRAQASAN